MSIPTIDIASLPSSEVAAGPLRLRVILHGLPPWNTPPLLPGSSSPSLGSTPQKHYYAVFIYDSEVNNGGHSQYFVNSSGDQWQFALEGLKTIGASSRVEILCEATTLFGAAGPATKNGARHRQLAAFSKQKSKTLEALDSRYYSCEENVEALLAQFAIENKEHFSKEM